MLIGRGIDDPQEEYAYYLAYGPAQTPAEELIRIAGRSWQVEECFEAAKGEVGLEEYEVSKWDGWHRHITVCLIAHAYLAIVRRTAEVEEDEAKGGSWAGFLPRTDPTDGAGGTTSAPGDGCPRTGGTGV